MMAKLMQTHLKRGVITISSQWLSEQSVGPLWQYSPKKLQAFASVSWERGRKSFVLTKHSGNRVALDRVNGGSV